MKSFTLLEVILAITILTLAVGGSFILIQQTIGSVAQVQSRLIASYLLQEGMEIIKNIRDSNWLKGNDFDKDLDVGDWEIDYDDTALSAFIGNGRYLYIDGTNGFYTYPDFPGYSDIQTKFKRKITISEEKPDRLKVSVEVFWETKGKIYSIKSQEFLYNWNK